MHEGSQQKYQQLSLEGINMLKLTKIVRAAAFVLAVAPMAAVAAPPKLLPLDVNVVPAVTPPSSFFGFTAVSTLLGPGSSFSARSWPEDIILSGLYLQAQTSAPADGTSDKCVVTAKIVRNRGEPNEEDVAVLGQVVAMTGASAATFIPLPNIYATAPIDSLVVETSLTFNGQYCSSAFSFTGVFAN
jgi:hypothetical protein